MKHDIKKFETGPFSVNTWVLPLHGTGTAVIDPGGITDELLHYLQNIGAVHLEIMLTHGHFDHLAGLPALITAYPDYRLWIHKEDAAYLGEGAKEVHIKSFAPLRAERLIENVTAPLPAPTDFFTEGSVVNGFTVLHTPGHTPGSICLWNKALGFLISGDTLFYGSRGRTDLFGGNEVQLYESLRRIFEQLPEQTAVYPGHGPDTFIGFEKQFQQF